MVIRGKNVSSPVWSSIEPWPQTYFRAFCTLETASGNTISCHNLSRIMQGNPCVFQAPKIPQVFQVFPGLWPPCPIAGGSKGQSGPAFFRHMQCGPKYYHIPSSLKQHVHIKIFKQVQKLSRSTANDCRDAFSFRGDFTNPPPLTKGPWATPPQPHYRFVLPRFPDFGSARVTHAVHPP